MSQIPMQYISTLNKITILKITWMTKFINLIKIMLLSLVMPVIHIGMELIVWIALLLEI